MRSGITHTYMSYSESFQAEAVEEPVPFAEEVAEVIEADEVEPAVEDEVIEQ